LLSRARIPHLGFNKKLLSFLRSSFRFLPPCHSGLRPGAGDFVGFGDERGRLLAGAGAAAIPLPTTLEGASVEVIDGSGAAAHLQVTFLTPALECVPIPA
jgi:hypothetical protein